MISVLYQKYIHPFVIKTIVFFYNIPFKIRLMRMKAKHGDNVKNLSSKEITAELGQVFDSISEYEAALFHLCGELKVVGDHFKVKVSDFCFSQIVGFKMHSRYLESEYEEALERVMRAENSRSEILKVMVELEDLREDTITFFANPEFSEWVSEGTRLLTPTTKAM